MKIVAINLTINDFVEIDSLPELQFVDQINNLELSYTNLYIINCKNLDLDLVNFIPKKENNNFYPHLILLNASTISNKLFNNFINNFKLIQIITYETNKNSIDKINLNNVIVSGLFLIREWLQKVDLEKMISEKNETDSINLRRLQETSDRNQLDIISKQKELSTIEVNSALLRQSLWFIHRSENILEIEELLFDILKENFQLKSLRIQISSNIFSNLKEIKETTDSLKIEMIIGKNSRATLILNKFNQTIFKPSEISFFNHLSEAIELALKRFINIEQLHELQNQWQKTFDSITKPIFLIDDEFNILNLNMHAKKWLNPNTHQSIKNRKCFEILFNRNIPCSDCRKKQEFELSVKLDPSSTDTLIQVSSYKIKGHYLQIYEDITDTRILEQEAISNTLQSELGIVSGSIAHELNNPIGGILTLSQVLKMDYSENTPEFNKFSQIEKKALECKEIIENVLEFTHAQFNENISEFDFIQILNESLTSKNPFQKNQLKMFFKINTNTISNFKIKNRPNLIAENFYILFYNLHLKLNCNFEINLFLINNIDNVSQSKLEIIISPIDQNLKFPTDLLSSSLIKLFENLFAKFKIEDSRIIIEIF